MPDLCLQTQAKGCHLAMLNILSLCAVLVSTVTAHGPSWLTTTQRELGLHFPIIQENCMIYISSRYNSSLDCEAAGWNHIFSTGTTYWNALCRYRSATSSVSNSPCKSAIFSCGFEWPFFDNAATNGKRMTRTLIQVVMTIKSPFSQTLALSYLIIPMREMKLSINAWQAMNLELHSQSKYTSRWPVSLPLPCAWDLLPLFLL